MIPDKRISEGLFCPFFILFLISFYFFSGFYIAVIEGIHDKRNSECLFCPCFFEILFGVFIGIIGGGALLNVFLRVYFDLFFVFILFWGVRGL